jgi:predicted ribosome quality control (RQC) complex YloA/Tae2 family protein
MALDGLLLQRLVRELQPLQGAKIGKIQPASDDEIMINVHGKESGSTHLIISAHASRGRIYTSKNAPASLPSPSPFIMVLRKNISQGTITSITQAGFDRIVTIRISAMNEFQDKTEFDLQIELMGKYANILLVDAKTQTIIDCLKRIPVFENSKRLLHPGAIYALPEKPVRQNPLHPENIDLNTSFVSQFEGFSPQLSREFQYRIAQGEKFEDITNQILSSDKLYFYGKDYHCIPLLHLSKEARVLPFMEGIAALYEQTEKKDRLLTQCKDVIQAVNREVKKLERKLPKLEQSLQESGEYDKYREYGDLLFAYQYEIQREKTITLPSFEEEGKMVTIPIDMRYDIKDNANLYYKKYRKLKRAQSMLDEQIEQCKIQIETFTQMQEQLKHCSVEDIAEIRQELVDRKILRNQNRNARKKQKRLHYLHLRIKEENADIFVGKNNLQNQFLTFKLAGRSDTWFHVKDYHGSHIILKAEKLNETLIRLCAQLAAYYSKGKLSSSVPVDYTTVSQLKKVPGAAPGFVIMKSYQTIYIDPDQETIEEAIKKYQVKN